MLDDISPEQFIEGLNENEKVSPGLIDTHGSSGVAIQYRPKMTYSLKKIEIFLVHQMPVVDTKVKCKIYTDYKDNPSDIVLCAGVWLNREKPNYPMWQPVVFEKPAVVIINKLYWFSMEWNDVSIGLPIIQEGELVPLRFNTGDKWTEWDANKSTSAMIKFYGRILPILG